MSDKSKILIVDDDLLFVNDLSELLESFRQYEVLTATSRGEELFILRQEKIAVLVVNLHGGGLNGLEVLSLVSTSYRHIQCIVMTNGEHPAIKAVANCSCKDSIFLFLAKPSNLETIGCAVLESLQRLDENDYQPGISVAKIVAFFEAVQKTARISVRFGSKKHGLLDFDKGILINAACEKKKAAEAALEIFDWQPLGFLIESEEYTPERTISTQELETIRVTSRLKRETAKNSGLAQETNRMAQQKIGLFIVDDSKMMRKVIAGIFKDDPFVQVVGEAENGEEALQLIPQLKPDVITLDVEMPIMDGLKTIKHLMIQAPTPTVMLSSMTQDGAIVTFDALKYGAVDFVAKPSRNAETDLEEQTRDIARKVHLAAEVELEAVRYVRAVNKDKQAGFPPGSRCEKVVAIGAAEGGYGALLKLLPHLSAAYPAAYLVMFYAPAKHLDAFVEYMDRFSPLRIRRAENNAPLEPGVCYFASGEKYMTVHEREDGLVLHLSSAPFATQRGSINMLFFSVAEIMKDDAVAVILSGVGEDGTEGMAEILRVGGAGIVQDPAGCLYRDMPWSVSAHCREAAVLVDAAIPETIHGILSA
ncbi:MAG: Chemotaxis response regulator CheB [Candidatus Electronema aureum]|uniref:protein-glutamate methylesterase n=1 Tax=Candidatus Electronema aureum TaxID=2005002 RepID=A0A521G3F8_9BACT|nr:MAG: Chemotaxis response regulator CheB [Candidatus Electronema aureum]